MMAAPHVAHRTAWARSISGSMLGLLRERAHARNAMLRTFGEAIRIALEDVFGHEDGIEAASAIAGGILGGPRQ